MKIRVLRDNVLIRVDPDPSHGICDSDGKHQSLIEMPEDHSWQSRRATVVAVGKGGWCNKGRVRRPCQLKVGDRVAYPPTKGQILIDEKTKDEYRIIPEGEIELVF